MRGKRGIEVFMLSPHGRMSPFQQAQMFSLQDANIHNIADRRRVRRLPGHRQGGLGRPRVQAPAPHRHGQLDQLGAPAGAGRLLLRRLLPGDDGATTSAVSFAVPSGNFGNICAGHVARMMGLPIARLVLATNENDVLDEFFRTGRYRVAQRRRDARDLEPVDGHLARRRTSSASSSTCSAATRRARAQLFGRGRDATARFALDAAEFAARSRAFGFVSGRSTHADRLATIRARARAASAR